MKNSTLEGKALIKSLPDLRYTCQPEWCGFSTPQYVARFCGEWIESAPTQSEAIQIAWDHRRDWLQRAGIASTSKQLKNDVLAWIASEVPS